MSLAEQLGVELQAAMATEPRRLRLPRLADWRANWLAIAFCALLAAAAGLIVTASQVARAMDGMLAARELAFAETLIAADAVDMADSAAVHAFAHRHGFAGGRAVGTAEALMPGEAVATVSGHGGLRFAFQPTAAGSQLLARFAPTRIPFILAALALVGWLMTQYWRLTRTLERERSAAAELARRDPLTGLVNRLGFREALSDRLACGETFSLACLDLDGFKRVNDTLGHGAGDEVLQAVARRIAAALGEGDIACRLGGDEFAVLVHGETGDVKRRIRKVLLRVSEPIGLSGGQGARVGASAGVATAWIDGDQADTLLLVADQALYQAKRQGGSYCFAGMESDLRVAL